jgi:uncharacterized protein YdcH (DUF465 family)
MDDAATKIIETFAEIDDDIHRARAGADGKATDAALDHAIQALHGLRDKVVELAIKVDNLEAAGD